MIHDAIIKKTTVFPRAIDTFPWHLFNNFLTEGIGLFLTVRQRLVALNVSKSVFLN